MSYFVVNYVLICFELRRQIYMKILIYYDYSCTTTASGDIDVYYACIVNSQ